MSLLPDHKELLQNEEYLHSLHNKVLEENRDFLCRNGTIEPKHHFTYLRSKGILNREICEEINHVVGPMARASRFIDELQRNGGPKAFTCFLESLRRDGTQIFVLRRLNKALEDLIRSPPPMAPADNGFRYHPHQSREFEESSIASEGDVSNSPLDEEPHADSSTHPLRPGDPGAPPLPSFESLAKCTHSQGPPSGDFKPASPILTEH
ncbi:B-cell lymphoma/leukemia 10-like [Acanthaster planci]|uniref:B-cell lymphoma/leukemia 10-like n=1 Tax=Acanthaster planci TaxID=133434 RepID=A0A8B7ZU89_ACAPL|nr:B-cell lymphoma/leukemia 10-like [Acanthaster planci]